MKTKVIQLDSAKPDRAQIEQAARLIDAGSLVGFPTETVYGIACRVQEEALSRLDEVKGRAPDKYYTLHISEKSNVDKYVGSVGLKSQKLIGKVWPGPVTIVFELGAEDIEKQRDRLDEEVFKALYKNNTIGIRCPDNTIALELLAATENPVVAPSANIAGSEPAISGSESLAQLNGKIPLILDGGLCKYKKSSTIVKIGKGGLKVLRAGVYSEAELEALCEIRFMFVCTGNTCRSPMGAGIFARYLAEKIGCRVDQLAEKGYKILSAGTMGIVEMPASPESIQACGNKGIDLTGHKSRGLSLQLVDECDFIFAMTEAHRQRVIGMCPAAAERCVLLAGDKDVPDPIGQSQEVYRNCMTLIEKAVKRIVWELVI